MKKYYAVRDNIMKKETVLEKQAVIKELPLDHSAIKEIQTKIANLQKILNDGKMKVKRIEEVEKQISVVGEKKRTGKHKTFEAAQKDKNDGQYIDFWDGDGWHEGVIQAVEK